MNPSTKNSILLILFSAWMLSCQIPNNIQGQLRFEMQITSDSFAVAEPIIAHLKITNQSKEKIGLRGRLNLGFADDLDSNTWFVIKKNDKPIHTPKAIHYSFIKEDSITFIEQDEYWEATIDITPFYPFNLEKGQYQLEARFLDTILMKTSKLVVEMRSNKEVVVVN